MTRGRLVALGFLLLFAIASLPVLTASLPPLFDYPNHLARMHILAEAGQGTKLDLYYALNWAWQPNLAMDLIVPPLAHLIPLELASRLFLLLTLAMLAGGPLLLHRVVAGRWTPWPLVAFLFLYSRVLLWGFLNYLFGVGLAFLALTLWLVLENRPAWLRAAIASVLALALYFSHIAAFGAYGLMVAGLELAPLAGLLRVRQWRGFWLRLTALGVQFLAPFIIFILTWQGSGDDSPVPAHFWRKADLLFSVFDNYDRAFDVICFALLAGLIIGLAVTRRLGLAARPAGALALLGAGYLLLPSQLLGGSGADHRIPVVLFLLLAASASPRLGRRAAMSVAGFLGILFLARMAVVAEVWHAAEPVYDEARAALDTLPEGTRLAVGYSNADVHSVEAPEIHLPLLAVVDRDAFVSTIFAYPTQQPILRVPFFDGLADLTRPEDVWGAYVTNDGDHAEVLKQLNFYDFVALVGTGDFTVTVEGCLSPRFKAPGFQLWAMDHTRPGCAKPY